MNNEYIIVIVYNDDKGILTGCKQYKLFCKDVIYYRYVGEYAFRNDIINKIKSKSDQSEIRCYRVEKWSDIRACWSTDIDNMKLRKLTPYRIIKLKENEY